MPALEPVTIQCPYCWEEIEILLDPSVERQSYVEDCQVCCRPITLHVAFDDGLPSVEALGEEDA